MTVTTKRQIAWASIFSLAVPGLGAAYVRAWKLAATHYGLGFALTGILYLELPPRIACVSRYLMLGAVLAITAAVRAARRAHEIAPELTLRWWVVVALVVVHVGVVVPFTWLYVSPLTLFQIDAHSMTPTLQVGDFFVVRKHRWPFERVEHGDVVLFEHGDEERVHVKRAVALGGAVVDACGYELRINGVPLKEPYVKYRPRAPTPGCRPVRVPPGEVFVLGDNRIASTDSREHGSISLSNVVGRAWFVLLATDTSRIGKDVR